MIDTHVYNYIYQMATTVLQRHQNQYGAQFCQAFLNQYHPNNGQQGLQNAQALQDTFLAEVQRVRPGQSQVDDNTAFQLVKYYIDNIFQNVSRQQSQPMFSNGGGFGRQPTGGLFTQQQNTGFGGGGGFNTGQAPVRPASHLVDDTQSVAPMAQPTPAAQPSQPRAAMTLSDDLPQFTKNPLDALGDQPLSVREIAAGDAWGTESPRDRTIIVQESVDIKTQDGQYVIRRSEMAHRLILSDPFDVVRDFFKVVTDSYAAKSFIARILYNHVETIQVPTDEFIFLRDELNKRTMIDTDIAFYKQVIQTLNQMTKGSSNAANAYFVQHVNRALHLACRMDTDPSGYVKINDIDDLEELLSPHQKFFFSNLTGGRDLVKTICETAIWNAMTSASGLMFEKPESIPVRALQASPAFPYGMRKVYPTKWAIPTQDMPDAFALFFQNLQEHELKYKSYIISQRAVVITNILGSPILGQMDRTPRAIKSGVLALLNTYAQPFSRTLVGDYDNDYTPLVDDGGLTADLTYTKYVDSKKEIFDQDISVLANHEHSGPTFPADQVFISIPHGEDPNKALIPFDVIAPINSNLSSEGAVVSRRSMAVLRPSA